MNVEYNEIWIHYFVNVNEFLCKEHFWAFFSVFLSVRGNIGPIATPDFIQNAPALPKTRSGNPRSSLLRWPLTLLPLKHLAPLPQGKLWGGSCGRSLETRRTSGTSPPCPTRRWWRCCSARGEKLQPEPSSPVSSDRRERLTWWTFSECFLDRVRARIRTQALSKTEIILTILSAWAKIYF